MTGSLQAKGGYLSLHWLGVVEVRDGKEEWHCSDGEKIWKTKNREQQPAVKSGTADRRRRHAVQEERMRATAACKSQFNTYLASSSYRSSRWYST